MTATGARPQPGAGTREGDSMQFAIPGETVRHEPRPGVAYVLKVPTLAERLVWRREVEKLAGGLDVTDVWPMVRRGLAAMDIDDATRAAHQAAVDGYLAALQAQGEAIQQAEGEAAKRAAFDAHGAAVLRAEAGWVEVQRLVARHYEPLADLLADLVMVPAWRGLATVRLFLVAVEGVDVAIERAGGRLTPACEARLGILESDLVAIGRLFDGASAPTETEAKNSDSLSGGAAGPTAPSN